MFTKILVCCILQLQFVSKVDGVTLSLNPSSMVIGSSTGNPPMSLSILCSSSGTSDVDLFFQLQLNRRKFSDPTFTGIALMSFRGVPEYDPNIPSDIQNRSPNITGSVDTAQKSGTMTLSMNAQGLACNDQAEFQCELTYRDLNKKSQTVTENKNFTVTTVPSEVIIDSPEYYDVNGNTMQLTNNSVLNTGTRIKFRCTANVGSAPEGEIIWERSSEMGSMYSFIPYTPSQVSDIEQESSQRDGCFYRRTSTMYYNLTKLDEDGISFRCKARSFLSNQWYEALANQQYRAVAASSGGANKQVAGSVATAQGGVIAGAVIGAIAGVVLIIVLIYFLWYRRRSSGESYRTKEEGERPEPPPTDYTYTMPDKKKMDGYDNKGLEEPQEKTRYPRSGRGGFDAREGRNGRGHHNPGMDDEDGGTMHMSSGPIGTGV